MKRIKLKKKNLSENSSKWLKRHLNDEFVIKSKAEGYRSRSSYKLIEIEKKFKVFQNCNYVLDLGCAPGGWLQVVRELSPKNTAILGIDKIRIEKVNGTMFIEKDIFEDDIIKVIKNNLNDKIDVLMSDMSPNSSGNKSVDHLRIISLVEKVVEIAKSILKPEGILISKIFQGGAQGELIEQMKRYLKEIKYFKPRASRRESPETYLIAKKN